MKKIPSKNEFTHIIVKGYGTVQYSREYCTRVRVIMFFSSRPVTSKISRDDDIFVVNFNILRDGRQGPGPNVDLHLRCEGAPWLRRRRGRARGAPLDFRGSGSKLRVGPKHSEGAGHLRKLHPLVVLLGGVHDDLRLDLPLCEEMCKDAVSDFYKW